MDAHARPRPCGQQSLPVVGFFFNVSASHFLSIHFFNAAAISWMDMDAWTVSGKILEKKTRNPQNCVHPFFGWAETQPQPRGPHGRGLAWTSTSVHIHVSTVFAHVWAWRLQVSFEEKSELTHVQTPTKQPQ